MVELVIHCSIDRIEYLGLGDFVMTMTRFISYWIHVCNGSNLMLDHFSSMFSH